MGSVPLTRDYMIDWERKQENFITVFSGKLADPLHDRRGFQDKIFLEINN